VTRIVEEPVPDVTTGQVLLRIDRFGLSANNVTYAVTGDQLGYWGFFPAEEGWGRIPVWGFAEVEAGDVPGLETGTRLFGYFPMATHLVVQPSRVSERGFVDTTSHRATLPGVYNGYRLTQVDPLHTPATEDVQAAFVPLFATSFVLEDFLADQEWFGATQVVLSSASSKTAAGTALCIGRRADRPHVVGLTSPRHADFAAGLRCSPAGLRCYDSVLPYDRIEALDPSTPTVFLDIAGDATVRTAVHQRFGDALRYSCTVGITHWTSPPVPGPLPGPRPVLFFAPSQIDKRMVEWGPAGYEQRLAAAWADLLAVVRDWVDVVEVVGLEAAPDRYRQLLDGGARPDEAMVVSVHP
jgi:hypothetical protein